MVMIQTKKIRKMTKKAMRNKAFYGCLMLLISCRAIFDLLIIPTISSSRINPMIEDDIMNKINSSSTELEIGREENDIMNKVNNGSSKIDFELQVKKALETYDPASSKQSPPNTVGAFIHMGKTGGSTLSLLLRNGCHSFVTKPCYGETVLPASRENFISKLTTYYHVPDFQNGYLKKYSHLFYVITIRDPFSKAISAFRSAHPLRKAQGDFIALKNSNKHLYNEYRQKYANELDIYREIIRVKKYHHEKIYKCFDTLEEYAQLLANYNDYEENSWEFYLAKKDCANLAKTMLHHISPATMKHNFYDLRGVLSQVQNIASKVILLIRTEFMWDDWTSANKWLGDENEIYTNPKTIRNSTETKIPFNSTLSDEGRNNLCIALEEEYRVYLRLLVLSQNLSEEDIANSLSIARENCPCLDLHLPKRDVPTAIVPSKGFPVWYL